MEPALGAAAGLGRWFVGVAVLLNNGVIQMWRYCSATTAHTALPVCEWPVLGMLLGTASSNAVSLMCSRCGGAYTGCCGRAAQVVVCCGVCGSAAFWSFSVEEALIGSQSAQSPASL